MYPLLFAEIVLQQYYIFVECLIEFICEAIWTCSFGNRKVFYYEFNFFNGYKTVQIFYFFLVQFSKLCFTRSRYIISTLPLA